MSILIVRGPAGQGARGPVLLPRGLLGQLAASVGEAGHALSVRACGDERELLDALRLAHPSGGHALILDAGAAAGSARLARVLASLQLPRVDVDVRAARTAGFADDAKHGCLARVRGYGMQGYMLAAYILLEHLGCSGWSESVHVGT
ncbi:MAG: 3-dehydroquinate dehydratase [Gammaproteobacteria bacterium]